MVKIVGAGLVGSTMALGLAQSGIRVTLYDTQAPVVLTQTPDLRVVALNASSIQWLKKTGVWNLLDDSRIGRFHSLCIEDQGKSLNFETQGVILENNHIVSVAQTACLNHPLIKTHFSTSFEYEPSDKHLIIAAQGAHSALRQALNIPCFFHDYHQKALVAYVKLEKPHQNQAWQIFHPTGPLAFLPTADPHVASIVWTGPQDDIEKASEYHYGAIEYISQTAEFPLRLQLADQYYKNQVVFVGDAIHAIHPLAGQGVNLGFADASALLDLLVSHKPTHWTNPLFLKQYQRARKGSNLLMAHSMSAINFCFSGDHPWRTIGINVLDRCTFLKGKLSDFAS